MIGSTETALITFEGSFVPLYVLYYQAEYRCHPERPKAQFCQRYHKIGHRKDVCTLPPSTELCQTCSEDLTKLPPGQEHDCYATCRNCKGSHSSTWAECPEKLKADAKVTQQAYRRRLAIRKTDSHAPDNHRSRYRPRHRHPSTHGKNPTSTTKFEAQRDQAYIPNAKTQRTHRQHRRRDHSSREPATLPLPSSSRPKACLYTLSLHPLHTAMRLPHL
ncbi:hypothetical protein HPB48_006772 [Haemaphysalis longicornis]|uniref:Uncharacterized protein n=1 Tax=Haemaphysalis longicornis TaxID=44386 RepID=A0A9J6G940_HAELO|nr:hypothetical protein HPB48_006772 [Haemaphysalis longicornis]